MKIMIASLLALGVLTGATMQASALTVHVGTHHHRHCTSWGWHHHHHDRYCRNWGW
jgi:hypothetical protein